MAKNYIIIFVVTLIMIGAVIFGIFEAGTPWETRDRKIDQSRVTDISNLKNKIDRYYRENNKLPEKLINLKLDSYESDINKDPETGEVYEYSTTDQSTYKICATFTTSSDKSKDPYSYFGTEFIHTKGHYCFTFKVVNNSTKSSKLIGPNLFIETDKVKVKSGESFNLTVTARSQKGLQNVWWGVKDTVNTGINEIKGTVDEKSVDLNKAQDFGACEGEKECKYSRKVTIEQPGSFRIFANARQTGSPISPQASESSGIEEVAITVTK